MFKLGVLLLMLTSLGGLALDRGEAILLKKEASRLGIDVPGEALIEKHLNQYLKNKKGLEIALLRAKMYMPYILPIVKEYGLPEELALLPIVESGFNPFAVSRSGAGGIWQLMPETARRYGLKIDKFVDERFDVIKSTYAAVRYLKDLYEIFGRWDLVIAAYNCGEGCVKRRTRGRSFWKSIDKFPEQTRSYVPKFFALLLIAKDPEKYGLNLESRRRAFRRVKLDRNASLRKIVKEFRIKVSDFKDLNPHIKTSFIPSGIYIYLPESKKERAIRVKMKRKVTKRILPNGAVVYIKE